jgi:HEAT repeat protein
MEERAIAVKRLADLGKASDLVLIRHAAQDPAPSVRAEAAAALGRRREQGAADLLAELLRDPDEAVQASAATALAEIGGEKARAYLVVRYGQAGRSIRRAIVQALRAAGGVPPAAEAMVSAESAALWDHFLKTLEQGSAAQRISATEEIGKSGRPEAIAQLLALAQQATPLLASAAVRGLAESGDPSAAARLTPLLSENEPELRAAVCDALGRLGDLDSAPRLEAIAIEGSSASAFATAGLIALPRRPATDRLLCEVVARAAPPEALAAAREMRSRGGCPLDGLVQSLAAAIGPPGKAKRPEASRRPGFDLQRVESALRAIAALGPTASGALPKMLRLLEDPEPRLRLAALAAAAQLRDRRSGLPVQEAFETQLETVSGLRAKWVADSLPREYAPGFRPGDEEGSERQGAQLGELAARVRERNAAGSKAAAAGRGPPELADDVRQDQLALFAAAVLALGMVDAPDALTFLTARAADPSPRIRAAALAGSAYLGGPGLDLAKSGLADPEADVRSSVAQALVAQGAPGVKAVLADLTVQRTGSLELLEALQQARLDESAVERLGPFLSSGAAESALAAQLLGKSGAKSAVPALIKYLEDPVAPGRRQALVALGQIADPRAAEAIAPDLYHDSPEIRSAAAEALGRTGAASEMAMLEALRGDYYAKVRRAAHGAIEKLHSVSEAR